MTMPTKVKTTVKYEVAQSRDVRDEYVVEGIDYENDGQIYGALFNGPQAKERAEEYARFKNAKS